MASVLAMFPAARRVLQVHVNQLSSKWSKNMLAEPVNLFHGSSQRPNIGSRLIEYFKVSPKRTLKLQEQEKVPKDYALIYMAPVEMYMKYGYPSTLLFLITAPSIACYHYYKHGSFPLRREASAIPIANPEVEIMIFAVSLMVWTWAICAFLFKYPFRIYKHKQKQEFIAIYLNVVPLKSKKYYFNTAVQKDFRNPLYFFVPNCQFFLGGKKKAILMPHYFRTPADLTDMLGV